MPRSPVDPARLNGEALNRWYLRTPDDIEAERRSAEARRYEDFFGEPPSGAPGPKADPLVNSGSDALWVARGSGGYRTVRPSQGDFQATLEPDAAAEHPNYLPGNAAEPEAGNFTEVGNPHNPRLRREWEIANGRAWPRTADGRPFDVAHMRAIADGGTNTLDNIQPMDPAKHRASHKEDNSRWGKRAGIARAFGGKVEPPLHAPKRTGGPSLKGFGFLGLIPNTTGILSGRLRTDTPVHLWNDLLGYSSEDDVPPGDLIA